MARVLILYTFHKYTSAVKFFLQYAYIPTYTYYVIVNDPSFDRNLIPSHYSVILRENQGYDFGAWTDALTKIKLDYDYYIFINSTVTGPFYPTWNTQNWVQSYLNLLSTEVKLAGISINYQRKRWHVQSMLLVTDRIGFEIGLNNKIFSPVPYQTKQRLILEREVAYSQYILHAGYNIACMMKIYQTVDFRIKPVDQPDINNNPYLGGYESTPYESIMIKTNYPQLLRYMLLHGFEDSALD